MNSESTRHVFSLYRTYLRHVRALPHIHLRVKGADAFRSVLNTRSVELRRKRLKQVSKDLQRLQTANEGRSTAFDRMLDIAYGRVGKLRWELIEPLLSGPSVLRSPTNLRNDKTCSPTYSPELAALLTSGVSRTTRALQKHHLVLPPNSEDTTPIRPLSRRQYNIRWRFFRSECRKVYPPLPISLPRPIHNLNMGIFSDLSVISGLQNTGTLRELLALAGSPSRLPDPPSKQRKRRRVQNTPDANPFDGNLRLRWLRRRYQALLGKVPFLVPRPSLQDNFNRTYDVRLADCAMTAPRIHLSRLRVADAEDASWISDLMVLSGRRCR